MDGLDIKAALAENGLSQQWLRKNLERKGQVYDTADISRAVSGITRGERAQKIVSESRKLLSLYESTFGAAI